MAAEAARGSGSGAAGSGSALPTPRSALALALATPVGSQLAAELAALGGEEEEQEEEQELTCCVCREGYAVRPDQLLCAYMFCKAVTVGAGAGTNADESSGTSRSGTVPQFLAPTAWPLPPGGTAPMLLPAAGSGPLISAYSSVTHFNLIHASCHAAARAADANLRAPKREWDGATLRNGEVRGGGP